MRCVKSATLLTLVLLALVGSSINVEAQEGSASKEDNSMANTQSQKKMHFMVKLLGTRPNWPADMTPEEEAVMEEHYTYLVNLMNQGKMLLAGPVMNPVFGLVVLEVADEAEAKAIMDKEPSVVSGVHTYDMQPMVASLVHMRYKRPSGTDRMIEAEKVISAPVSEVWKAWTTSEGMESFLTQANIELRIHGPYELYFAPDEPYGKKGAEGCHVLSFVPERMLSFEWNAPPAVQNLRDANMRNWVVVDFEAVGDGQTKLNLKHLGWDEGEDWDANFAYFSKAWPYVLDACAKRFAGE